MRLFGCASKNQCELDGEEFIIETLKELLDILKVYKEVHLNYFENEKDLDMWIRLEGQDGKSI